MTSVQQNWADLKGTFVKQIEKGFYLQDLFTDKSLELLKELADLGEDIIGRGFGNWALHLEQLALVLVVGDNGLGSLRLNMSNGCLFYR